MTTDSKEGAYALHKDFKDFRPLLDRLSASEEFSTKAGATCLVRFNGVRGSDHVLVVGTGHDRDGVNQLGALERLRRLGAAVASKLNAEKVKEAVVHLDSFLGPASKLTTDGQSAAYAFAEGAGLVCYRFDKYFSKKAAGKEGKDGKSGLVLTFMSTDSSRASNFAKGITQAEAMLEGAYLCRDLSNEPSNELHPAEFAARQRN